MSHKPTYLRRPWTPAEIDRFKRLYASSTTPELVRAFRRSASSLFQKASLLQLKKGPQMAGAVEALEPIEEPVPAGPVVLDTTPTLHGTKTVYRRPNGSTVTRHVIE